MFCCTKRDCTKTKQSSSLPPPCYHCRPTPFYCPSDGCLPPEPRPRRRCYWSPSSLPLTCRPRPKWSPPPTICIAGPCPRPSAPRSYCRPSALNIPPSCVRFCIRYANEGSCYYPRYWSSLPKCTDTC